MEPRNARSITMKIVLASESQFRRRALEMLDLKFEICPSRIDEKVMRDPDPASLTQGLPKKKPQA